MVSPLPSLGHPARLYPRWRRARGLGVGMIVTIVSFLSRASRIHHPILTIMVVVLTALLFSIGGFINALFARKFDDISIIPTFVLTPLTYLGGVFYSISMLPDFWQTVSLANPILYMVNTFRYGILGVSDISVGPAMAAIVAFIIGLFALRAVACWSVARASAAEDVAQRMMVRCALSRQCTKRRLLPAFCCLRP